ALTLCSSPTRRLIRAEHRQFPGAGLLIMPHEICIAVGCSQFEVPVGGAQPRVDHLRDDDATVSKNQRTWRLLAAVACVALDTNAEEPLLRHATIIRSNSLIHSAASSARPRSAHSCTRRAQLIEG